MSDQSEETKQNGSVEIISGTTGEPISNSRRRFLANAGMFSAGLVGSSLLAACSDNDGFANAQDDSDDGISDAAVLQFALNLEYLEAEYYLRAVTGNGLMDDDINGGNMAVGSVTGGRAVTFTTEPLIGRYAAEIASDELDHVQFLRGGLGDGVIARPPINFTDAFNSAAQAAGLSAFDPFADPVSFLIGAFIFEDVGVTAYKGGARFLSNPDFLTAAAGILSVEGYHAGLVRTILTQRQDEPYLDTGLTVGQVVNAISGARDDLDGSEALDQGIGNTQTTVSIYGTSYSASNIVPTDDNGITFSRTPQQVHNIVYLTPMAQPGGGTVGSSNGGGFFPDGTRGTLTASAASADNSSDDG
ncbi:Dessication-associated protein [Salinisphaera shabanensis E1L3A]|uniref:Dessication-associated protein n=2 Tax=Salinisphaera shabanensis TaxID=180542 RepID=U2ENM1_9GAMM|nr:ferritin-like domain-containing protein [Salinisphaera shabanensis]ERJ19727.1 Dessication-associated protein [Salinisphaera shabanensis E1L3A]